MFRIGRVLGHHAVNQPSGEMRHAARAEIRQPLPAAATRADLLPSPPPLSPAVVVATETAAGERTRTQELPQAANPTRTAARQPGRLQIRVRNYGWVTIDGQSQGRAPVTVAVRAGTHRVEISTDRGEQFVKTETVRVQPGETIERVYDITAFAK